MPTSKAMMQPVTCPITQKIIIFKETENISVCFCSVKSC